MNLSTYEAWGAFREIVVYLHLVKFNFLINYNFILKIK